jgi:hypothetical protein
MRSAESDHPLRLVVRMVPSGRVEVMPGQVGAPASVKGTGEANLLAQLSSDLTPFGSRPRASPEQVIRSGQTLGRYPQCRHLLAATRTRAVHRGQGLVG